MKEVIDALFIALIQPKRWRRRLIKWIFPEIIHVAKILQSYYWRDSEHQDDSTLRAIDTLWD